jgi:hypothetical protein
MANSEGGRISQILQQAQNCAIQENLARARAFQGGNACVKCKMPINNNTQVLTESAYLISHTNCYNYVKPPVVPESVRINNLIQNVLSNETSVTNSNTRFSDYAPIPANVPCPPVGAAYLNASQPKPPTICPILPNSPLNPILPA